MNFKEIVCPIDFNGREAAQFVRLLSEKVKYSVFIEKEGRQANAHSILGILSLCLKAGDKLKIHCEDENSLCFIINLFNNI